MVRLLFSLLAFSVVQTRDVHTMLALILVVLFLILSVLTFYIYVKTTIGVCISSRHLVGKVVLVTGGTSGIGYETAADLAERGARVLIASNERHGDSVRDTIVARSGNTDVHFIYLDLASLESVRSVANEILSTEKRLDVLINNAGVLLTQNINSGDGLLIGMQINYFGPFLLTNLLLPLMTKSAPSRIINVSSISYKYGHINLERLNETFSTYLTYCNSKLCVALMTVELGRRLQGTGVTANFLHPGCVTTSILDKSFVKVFFKLFNVFTKTPRLAAQTAIHLAVSPEVENVSGCYFEDCKMKEPSANARNVDLARNLWNVTEELVNRTKSK